MRYETRKGRPLVAIRQRCLSMRTKLLGGRARPAPSRNAQPAEVADEVPHHVAARRPGREHDLHLVAAGQSRHEHLDFVFVRRRIRHRDAIDDGAGGRGGGAGHFWPRRITARRGVGRRGGTARGRHQLAVGQALGRASRAAGGSFHADRVDGDQLSGVHRVVIQVRPCVVHHLDDVVRAAGATSLVGEDGLTDGSGRQHGGPAPAARTAGVRGAVGAGHLPRTDRRAVDHCVPPGVEARRVAGAAGQARVMRRNDVPARIMRRRGRAAAAARGHDDQRADRSHPDEARHGSGFYRPSSGRSVFLRG